MTDIFLSVGILALSFSCIGIMRSLHLIEKRLTHVEDDNASQDHLLILHFLTIEQILKKLKNYEEK